jgi:CheY-like chemotaxis protein
MASMRVLVVDDEEDVRVLLCRCLAARGYAVESAKNGREALQKVEANRPDLVLLDLKMPIVDGWEVLRQFRDLPNPPPVLVVSGYLDHAALVEEGVAAECLSKPFGLGQLAQACERLMGSARSMA